MYPGLYSFYLKNNLFLMVELKVKNNTNLSTLESLLHVVVSHGGTITTLSSITACVLATYALTVIIIHN